MSFRFTRSGLTLNGNIMVEGEVVEVLPPHLPRSREDQAKHFKGGPYYEEVIESVDTESVSMEDVSVTTEDMPLVSQVKTKDSGEIIDTKNVVMGKKKGKKRTKKGK